MTYAALPYLLAFTACLAAATPLLGAWIAAVLEGRPPAPVRWLRPLEAGIDRIAGSNPATGMPWGRYAIGLLLFHALGFAALLALQLLQHLLPLNPAGFGPVPLGVAVNTAVSFITNTNWQAYAGEASLSYLTQMAGLGVQNFLSAATGLAVLAAVARGIRRSTASTVGNVWADITRSTVYILLPLSFILAVALAAQGVVQSFDPYVQAASASGETQTIPLGPAASQVAIKQLGTNGGGFFGVNSAHPLENPTPLSNFLQTLAILLLPAACVDAFGRISGARRHATVLLGVMAALFVATLAAGLWAQSQPHPALGAAAAWEGAESRHGLVPSILWSQATTAASNGSVNAMHASLAPLAGGLALWNMLLGEVVFGGVGSGLYGMVAVAVVAVFLAGLMVGRTPEYLGKKLGAPEVRLAATAVLLPCLVVLIGCALTFALPSARAAAGSVGPHVISEVTYAWASMGNNNGSAFGSLTATGDLFTWGGSVAMLAGRFGVILPMLALAGRFAAQRTVPPSSGTFPADSALFGAWLAAVLVIVAGLTFLPALTLGPVLEHRLLTSGRSL